IVLGIGVSLAASWLTSQDNVNPSTWQVSQYLASLGQHLLVAVAVFGVLVAGAVAAWRADVVQQDWVERRRLGKESIRIEEERQRTEVAAESGAANAVARREGGIALEAYGPIPMPKLKPSNCGVSGKNFVESVYIERDADLRAREILHKIARRVMGGEN